MLAPAGVGDVIGALRVVPERPDDDAIDDDLILLWSTQKRIITGSDLPGRLLRGIAIVETGRGFSTPTAGAVLDGAAGAQA
jgi:metal transporter CNNM